VAGDQALYNLYFIWAMNKDVYEGMPDDLRAIIDANSGMMASQWAGRAHDTGDVVGRDLMAAGGNEIAQLSEAETDRIKALGADVTAAWIAEMDDKGYDGAALVAAAQEAVRSNAD
jgi:TRAP-type C4-dicarboxylate transport system substrate-binding protein